jgi:hypothetical protein
MSAAVVGASMEIMELLLERGAAASINDKDKVSQFRVKFIFSL